MSKLSLEHIIRNIAEGKSTPSDNPKISLEHAIKNVHESVGTLGTDKFQGTQFKTVKTITPVVKPGHNERAETASAARNVAKGKQSLTMQGKVSESAPSDMSGVTAATQCPSESGKKKVIKETPAPNHGNAAQVASWPAAESGKKKVKECFGTMSGQGNEVGDYGRNTESGKKKVKEEVEQIDELSPAAIASYATKAEKVVSKIRNMLMKDQTKNSPKITRDLYNREKGIETAKNKMEEAAEPTGTVARRKIKYVARPNDPDPKSEKSTLGRTGQIKTKIIDEEKVIPGKTPVVFEPILNQVTPEGDMKAANKKHKKIVKEAIADYYAEDATTAIASKAAGSLGKKLLPGIGLAYGAADAYSRAKQGDYTGAALSGLSGLASTVPGVGTAAAGALDAANIYRDYKSGAFDDKKEEPTPTTPEPPKPVSTNVNKPKPTKPLKGLKK